MRIVVCVKEVLDPNAVNNYVLAGNLKIAADGRTLDVPAMPRLINAYDEQAMEAALRLRDAGADCRITAVSIGRDLKDPLKHCAALGADEIVAIARRESVDLIVMGSRGLSPVRELLLGSVSEKVIRHAHCAVTVVR